MATGASYVTLTAGVQSGDGDVTIGPVIMSGGPTPTPAPEPASLALFGTGALGLLALRRQRRR